MTPRNKVDYARKMANRLRAHFIRTADLHYLNMMVANRIYAKQGGTGQKRMRQIRVTLKKLREDIANVAAGLGYVSNRMYFFGQAAGLDTGSNIIDLTSKLVGERKQPTARTHNYPPEFVSELSLKSLPFDQNAVVSPLPQAPPPRPDLA